jgi:hypothetical protein
MPLIVVSEFEFNRVAAPRLPNAPTQYESRFHDQYSDVLRLYFNRVDSILGQLDTSATIPPTTNYTVATLPSAATSGAGARTFVVNALTPTFGSTVVGGGTVFTPVYSDGTNWKVG